MRFDYGSGTYFRFRFLLRLEADFFFCLTIACKYPLTIADIVVQNYWIRKWLVTIVLLATYRGVEQVVLF